MMISFGGLSGMHPLAFCFFLFLGGWGVGGVRGWKKGGVGLGWACGLCYTGGNQPYVFSFLFLLLFLTCLNLFIMNTPR